jgi:5-methylcytosine-specific restriction endonuclease McrA
MLLNQPVLVLNTGMIPIDIVTVRDAICLWYCEKARTVIDSPDEVIRSVSLSVPLPRVVSLLNFNRIPRRKVVYSKLNVIYRDDMVCQYCGKAFPMDNLTVDHVIPVSRWHKIPHYRRRGDSVHSWENQVCACKSCNKRKADRLLKEVGMKLRKVPKEPTYFPHLVVARDRAEYYGWVDFLNSYNCKIVNVIHTR